MRDPGEGVFVQLKWGNFGREPKFDFRASGWRIRGSGKGKSQIAGRFRMHGMNRKFVRMIFLTVFLLTTSFLSFSRDPNKSRTKATAVPPRAPIAVPANEPITFTEKVVPFIRRSGGKTSIYSAMPILVDPFPGYTARIVVPPNSGDYTLRIVPSKMRSSNIIIRRKR